MNVGSGKFPEAAARETHFPQLDGLRCVAFVAVLFHHSGVYPQVSKWLARACDWGWAGVELFFALSGFLITYLLLKEKERFHSIAIGNFYMRRVLRIWPLYFLLLTGLALWPLTLQHWDQMPMYWTYIHKIIVPFFLFSGNYSIITSWGDFVQFGVDWHIQPFYRFNILIEPCWSLCVEEQFYLVWPILLLLINRKRTLWLTLSGIALGSIIAKWWLYNYAMAVHQFYTLYYMNTPSHLDAIAYGAALAAAELQWPGWGNKFVTTKRAVALLALVVSFALVVISFAAPLTLDRRSIPWIISGINLSCGIVLLLALYWAPFRKFLSNKHLGSLGKLTFSMYLFHFSICDSTRGWVSRMPNAFMLNFFQNALGYFATWLVAKTTWFLIESRMLALRKYFKRSEPAWKPMRDTAAPVRELVTSSPE